MTTKIVKEPTFLKNNKIIKTISDYGHEAPPYLEWAFIHLKNIHKRPDLIRRDYSTIIDYKIFHYFKFINKNKIIDLSKSESYFLMNELRKGKEVSLNFKSEYFLKFSMNLYYWSDMEILYGNLSDKKEKLGIKEIRTDGRYFEFLNGNKKRKIIDIGYNFIKNNHLKEGLRSD